MNPQLCLAVTPEGLILGVLDQMPLVNAYEYLPEKGLRLINSPVVG